jgi:hypothetical protein
MENQETSQPAILNPKVNMPDPLKDLINNYNSLYGQLISNSNITQGNLVIRVSSLYSFVSKILENIVSGLLDFMKAFIVKVTEQDRKLAIQDKKLLVILQELDEYHKNLDNLANKLSMASNQKITPMSKEVQNSMYMGGEKTRKHRKHRRKISK